MLEAEQPPMHFLLGDDALYYTGNKLGTMQAEIAKWAPLTCSIKFEDEVS